ncbi:RNA polymerase sigma-70 factor (ECF subfamily) [Symbiobacterium terraclitae]|uniref:RNA polymerase sigma factor n=1 Tax=Symbiobacterium terraclitae TaxID=557451 RepID=A0ABS4JWY9_9FIRM|nr:RNA polymerase sigma-70 factor (ECF subfamily) [Symbiobacterium terraclitae]
MDESLLITAAQRGDRDAMAALYRKHRLQAYQTALIVLRDPHLADDLVQEAFIRAFREIGRCDPGRPFAPWLARIVINLCRNALRRRRLLPLALPDRQGAGDPGYAATEDRADLWPILERLSHAHREVLMLRYFHQFTEPEIAEILGLPLGTVKSRLHAARQAVKSRMEAPDPGHGKELTPDG